MNDKQRFIDLQIEFLVLQLKNIYSNINSINNMKTASQTSNLAAASIPVAFCMLNFTQDQSSVDVIEASLKDKAFLYWVNEIYRKTNLDFASDMSMMAIQLKKRLK